MRTSHAPAPFGESRENTPDRSARVLAGLSNREGSNQETDDAGAETALPALPELTPPSLPKGGGAISGLGEKFETNAFNGTGSLAIPIATSPGRGGSGPQLSLSYNSGAGNGPFGLGFRLSPPAITRKTDRGLPQYLDADESDVFLLAGAEDLVPALQQEGETWTRIIDEAGDFRVFRYRPRIESGFARIERWEDQRDGTSHFRVTSGSNVTSFFGRTAQSRIAASGRAGRIFSWLLDRVEDDRGNVSIYRYKPEDLEGVDVLAPWEQSRGADRPQRYLERIRYGNRRPLPNDDGVDDDWMFEVVFDYGEYGDAAPDPETEFAEDLTISLTPSNPWAARPDSFSTYRAGFEIRTHRLCRRVLMFHRFEDLGPDPVPVASTDLYYETSPFGCRLQTVSRRGYVVQPNGRLRAQALPPLTLEFSPQEPAPSSHAIDADSLADLGGGVDASQVRLVDLDGDGLPGLLVTRDNAWAYKAPRGNGGFGPVTALSCVPTLAHAESTLSDLDGNGRLELVTLGTTAPGSYEREPDSGALRGRFRPMLQVPVGVDVFGPDVRQVDVTGDNLADMLVDCGDHFQWFGSAGRDGYAAPVLVAKPTDVDHGPAIVYGTASVSIATADMSGDGLADIVRIESDSVVYWPNLGYGRFGNPIIVGIDGPIDRPDQFRADRIRVSDTDGSGPADLIYFGEDGAVLWRNASGNRMIGPIPIPGVPPVHSLAHADVVDLEGTGTACVVWSSSLPADAGRQLRYVRLHQTNPNLLVRTINGLGLETRVAYAASTQFALADRAAGRPWQTRLPFPVQVIARVETLDHITEHHTVATYTYHHGFYDGREREFRGFARVDRRDTESFAHFTEPALFDTGHRIQDETLHVPPVITRTWFHTGAYLGHETLAGQLRREYRPNDPQAEAFELPDTRLPANLTPAEAREAMRALKGSTLREEIYAEDGSDPETVPYTVAERNLTLRLLQPQADQRHAVFLTHEHESLQVHYERDVSDPRVTHSLVLEVDDFGIVRRSAQVAYPRRVPLFPEQHDAAIIVAEADVEHQAFLSDRHRLASAIESRTFEITGVDVSVTPFRRITAAELEGGTRRLLSRSQVRYYRDDLSGPLPPGQAGLRALVFEERAAALSAAQFTEVFPTLEADVMEDEGRYLLSDGLWWTRSGRRVFDPNRFFVVTEVHDPFGNVTALTYDDDVLFVTRLTDPLSNRSEAEFDRRVLAPKRVIDLNDNVVEATFDMIGLVTTVAVRGKPELSEGDTLEDPTSRFLYNLWAFHRGEGPTWSRTEQRETHRDPQSRFLPQITYTDGRGLVVQHKVRAEPGPVPHLGPDTVAERWVGNGRTIRNNNKGDPVKQYEPYFSATEAFEDEAALVEQGVTPLLHYDPLGRIVRTDFPDGTFSRAEWSPWHRRDFDPGDTVLDSRWHAERNLLPPNSLQRRAAELSERYHDTPTLMHVDTLGRAVRVVADLGNGVTAETRSVLDIQGNVLQVIDARGNTAEERIYGMLGQALQTDSVDAGQRRVISDVTGGPLRLFDDPEIGRTHRFEFDTLRRMTHHWVQPSVGDELLVTRNVYGEAAQNPTSDNLRGTLLRQYDSAGVVENMAFDFEGNLLRQERRLSLAHDITPDWVDLATETALAALDTAAAGLLETEVFATEGAFDALGRLVTRTTPDGSVIRFAYNEAGLLESVQAEVPGATSATTFIDNFDYDVHGRRAAVSHGNGTTTAYEYDPISFRLTRILTTRAAGTEVLQDLTYTYDAVGNIVELRDAAQQTIYFDNAVVEPNQRFEYDAWYRLTQASGREHTSQGQPIHNELNPGPQRHPNDPAALRRYTEHYEYDPVGNILQHQHVADGGNWTREYVYDTAGNRLLSSSGPGDPPAGPFASTCAYDAHGNMTAMLHLEAIDWDYADRMQHANRNGGGDVFFQYDSAGNRVRKTFVTQAAGLTRERIYLGGFELFRERLNGELRSERQTLHISDDTSRIAMVETLTVDNSAVVASPSSHARYQHGNQLGSVSLELDESAQVISYEEFHPYGTSAYRAVASGIEVSARRYRYTGVERDEETGLDHMGARYYAPWLGRWTAADPIGLGDGVNRYAYVRGNPVTMVDPTGTSGEPHSAGSIITESEFQSVVEGSSSLESGTIALKLSGTEGEHFVTPGRALQYDISVAGQDADHVGVNFRNTVSGRHWAEQYNIANYKVALDALTALGAERILASNKMIAAVSALAVAGAVGGLATARLALALEGSGLWGLAFANGGGGLVDGALSGAALSAIDGGSAEDMKQAAVEGAALGFGAGFLLGGVTGGYRLARPSNASALPSMGGAFHVRPPALARPQQAAVTHSSEYYSEVTDIAAARPGHPALGSNATRRSGKSVMGMSATDVTGIPGSQWGHAQARQLLGADVPSNLIAMTSEANYQMGRIEALAARLQRQGQSIAYSQRLLNGRTLNLTLTSDGNRLLNLNLDILTQVRAPRGRFNVFNVGFRR